MWRGVDAGAGQEFGEDAAAAGAVDGIGDYRVFAADGFGVGGIGRAFGAQDGEVEVEEKGEVGVAVGVGGRCAVAGGEDQAFYFANQIFVDAEFGQSLAGEGGGGGFVVGAGWYIDGVVEEKYGEFEGVAVARVIPVAVE